MNQLESILSGYIGPNPSDQFVDGRRLVTNQSVSTEFKEPPIQIDTRHGQFQMTGRRKSFSCTVRDTLFENCNFAKIELEKMTFQNCVFSKCKFEECRLFGSTFDHCVFEGTKFINHHTGTSGWIWKKKSHLTFCTFRKCKFKYLTSAWPEYRDCLFEDCDLRKVSFDDSSFERCTFNTLLDETEFYGRNPRFKDKNTNTLKDCDFRGAKINFVSFFYLDLDPKYLPDDDDILLIPRGPADMQEWKKRISPSNGPNDSYIDGVSKWIGRPSIESRSALEAIYSPEEMLVLYEIIGATEKP